MTLDAHDEARKNNEITKENFLSFTVEQYEQMPVSQLLKAAQFAGLDSSEAFLLLMQRGKVKGTEAVAQQKKDQELRERIRVRFQYIPPQARLMLNEMQVSDAEIERAHALETEAYNLFGVNDTESKKKFQESQRLIIGRRFADLCVQGYMPAVIQSLIAEMLVKMRHINMPFHRDAIETELSRLEKWVHTVQSSEENAASRWNRGPNGPYGPAEVFEIETQKRYPANPRSPHRKNDELKGY